MSDGLQAHRERRMTVDVVALRAAVGGADNGKPNVCGAERATGTAAIRRHDHRRSA